MGARTPLTSAERSRFLELTDRHFGIRTSDYGAARIDDAVTSVLARSGYANPGELLESIQVEGEATPPMWLYELVEHLTVGETYLFRGPGQVAALRSTVLPDLVRRRTEDRRLRIWSAGCSTGEEPYTLAILLKEQLVPSDWDVMLIGTDVNRESLRVARRGQYSAWSFRGTPDSVRERYFEPVENGWQIVEPIRRAARFAWMNLAADPLAPPAEDIDLIVCRNVTIYFDDAAAQRLYRALVGALAVGGWLMLGASDPLPVERDGLERVEKHGAVLWRRTPAASARRVIPTPTRLSRPAKRVSPTPVQLKAADLAARADTAAGALGPRTAQGNSSGETETASGQGSQSGGLEARIVHGNRGADVEAHVSDGKRGGDVETPMSHLGRSGDLEAGLLALEAGSSSSALQSLRRATFRDPDSAMAQFGLARAYLDMGDRARAHAAFVYALRLLAPLDGDGLVPGSDALLVGTLRQMVQTHLEALKA